MAFSFLVSKSKKRKSSFWIKCICILIVAMLLPLAALFIFNTQQYNNTLEEALLINNISALTNMSDTVDDLYSSLFGIRDTLLLNHELKESYSPLYYEAANNLQKLLLSYVFVNPSISEILLHTDSDEYIFSSRSSYTANTLQGKFVLSDDDITNIWNNQFPSSQIIRAHDNYFSSDCLIYCFSFKSQNNVDRTLLIEIPTNAIETIVSRSNLPENSHIFLMRNDGQISYSYPDAEKDTELLSAALQFPGVKNIQNQPVTISSSPYYLSLQKSRWFGGYLVLISPAESALSLAIKQKNMSIILLLVTLLISCIFIYPLLQLINAPISSLKKHVQGEEGQKKNFGSKKNLLPEAESIISYIDDMKQKNESLHLHITNLQHDYDQILLTRFLMDGIHQIDDFSNLHGFELLSSSAISYFIFVLQPLNLTDQDDVSKALQFSLDIPGKCTYIMMPNQDTNAYVGLVLLATEYEEDLLSSIMEALPNIQNLLNTPVNIGIGGCYQNFEFAQQSLMEAYCAVSQTEKANDHSIISEFTPKIDNEAVEELFGIITSQEAIKNISFSDINQLLSRLSAYISPLDYDIPQAIYITYKTLVFVNNYVSAITTESQINLYPYIIKLASYQQAAEINSFMIESTTTMLKKAHLNPSEQRSLLYNEMQHYIDEHISDPMFSVSDMADHFKMSVAILSKYFKDKSDTGVMDYMAHKRIEKACKLLSETTMPVKDISVAIGYYNDSSFIRRFKNTMGVSPGQYRKEPDKYKIPEISLSDDP